MREKSQISDYILFCSRHMFFLSDLLCAVSYSPFSNLLKNGILLIGLANSSFYCKLATPNASFSPLIDLKLAS